MAKDQLPTKLETSMWDLAESITKLRSTQELLVSEQRKTNALLDQLVKANNSFLGTLTVFLDMDHRMKMEQERKSLEYAKSRQPSNHDLQY